ncbi:hypothetical protein TPHA_0M00470 [Tetrapisispora phaffii CBS 4417]|uniref:Phosphatidylglycerol/phosphatidylinositol transfer protein n=1 Tax=Tetrapisispora phaffii (strain ATCC 24235 / CBS 4417 / NBRC 1672 / NRRL Y-8282 / UCD 70-5) TaxID=1071381 RepID=G8C0W1_TETPH|nr:hypothetical protein TPHA_0M00470 [Tetrapisispora phaffii CBS 4417]CCE65622.1 hypothetical protein TPHA_0M00470 [Tetrapisispora phaffii CBS 4417]
MLKLWVWALLFQLSTVWSFQINAPFFAKGQPPVTDKEPIPGDSSLQHCDLAISQVVDITQVNLSPNPPARGKDLTISASGTVASVVGEGSYVDVEVRLGYVKLLTQKFDLCQMLSDNDIAGLGECPIQKGAYSLTKAVRIPDEVPPGKYTVLARAYNEHGELLTCITGDIVFPVDML